MKATRPGAGILLLLMGLSLFWNARFASSQVQQDQSRLKANTDKLQQERLWIEAIKHKQELSQQNIAGIQQNLEQASRELEAASQRYETVQAAVDTLNGQLQTASTSWDQALTQAQQRLRKMYKFRRYAEANQWLEAQNLPTLMRRAGYFRYLARHDEALLNDIALQKTRLERLKYQQILKRQELGRKAREQQEIRQKYVLAKQHETEYLLLLAKDRDFYEREAKALESESQTIAARLQNLSQPGSLPPSGRFIHPVIGPMTSPYGWRIHPIFGTRRLHTGQDFGVETGTPIRAAADGKVIEAGWIGGYGKALMIDHGGGIVTLYGHTSAYYVAAGQTVRQGQIIAASGSTGNSTGPHLHLEVRKNGEPVDPLGYF